MKKIYIFIVLSLLVTRTVQADNKTYYPPQIVNNCYLKTKDIASCNFNNTFLALDFDPSDKFGGDYIFQAALTRWETSGLKYIYKNKKGDTIALISGYSYVTSPDIDKSGNAWKRIDGHFECTSINANDCPFTHTPWAAEQIPFDYIATAKTKSIPLKQVNSEKIKLKFYDDTIITNNTNYPISLHIDDFNTVSFQFLTQEILPHRTEKIIGTLPLTDENIFMIDMQLGSGLRNTDNTSVILRYFSGAYFQFILNTEFMLNDIPIHITYERDKNTITVNSD